MGKILELKQFERRRQETCSHLRLSYSFHMTSRSHYTLAAKQDKTYTMVFTARIYG